VCEERLKKGGPVAQALTDRLVPEELRVSGTSTRAKPPRMRCGKVQHAAELY
jgi:hypothetical protein